MILRRFLDLPFHCRLSTAPVNACVTSLSTKMSSSTPREHTVEAIHTFCGSRSCWMHGILCSLDTQSAQYFSFLNNTNKLIRLCDKHRAKPAHCIHRHCTVILKTVLPNAATSPFSRCPLVQVCSTVMDRRNPDISRPVLL